MRRVFSVLGFPFPVTREFWSGKVDFQTLVVREQVNFNYWIEELISNDQSLEGPLQILCFLC
jgi:hypothetical protein